jgi:hypothetical protein
VESGSLDAEVAVRRLGSLAADVVAFHRNVFAKVPDAKWRDLAAASDGEQVERMRGQLVEFGEILAKASRRLAAANEQVCRHLQAPGTK